ncbi:peptide ABC transporter permease [Rhodospirillum rubrum]|uniref:ABC transporter permease n=1 Tax=Rhodospirillum rubrum TaxID=1085 RepID=UPI001906E87C|nr:ABC transporter permease [Rhodospirillum rubrum]MBK1663941.1 peptide ABC transporter permease [Rhodospirillum rubrum]MBK1676609.1 peptide ABC transporter permease [Rhodospirillum rubrum]
MTSPLSSSAPRPAATDPAPALRRRSLTQRLLANWSVRLGGGVLAILITMAIAAPWLGTIDPTAMDPGSGNLLPGTQAEFITLAGDSFDHFFLMGSDSLGRDIWSRALFGARVSITVGISAALVALVFGMTVGMAAGYFRRLDTVVMRIMDGVMAIPGILFAISLVALFGGTLPTVIAAIAIPEIPRVGRLVRSVVLTIREEPYVEAAIALDTPTWKILLRHIMPNAVAPLIIQGTYVCASAILIEAILSFLGVGLPADMATWGNIMAEGRSQFNQYPHNVLFPGIFLVLTVLSVNILGDGLRDTLDPKFNKRGG